MAEGAQGVLAVYALLAALDYGISDSLAGVASRRAAALFELQNFTLLLDEDRVLLAGIYQGALARSVPPALPQDCPGAP